MPVKGSDFMTGESDLFCMILSACRGMTACFRLRTEAAADREKNISLMVFSYCSEDLKCVIIRNKLLRTKSLFEREVLFRTRPSGTVPVERMEGALWQLRREW